ncbi:D-aminoacyl-tRNA deacylase [Mycena kentingensis (nom. inval.)]|nr:D-aminoacyl-tRNA deacylase [Mycena kentingensis (nom. inval.)]
MRAVIQRVASASVSVDGEVISQIGRGLMVLVGIGREQMIQRPTLPPSRAKCTPAWSPKAAADRRHSLSLRVFSDPGDESKMWKKSVKDIDGDVLCVSQFTLMAQTKKGSKPDFHNAMATTDSRALYSTFLDAMRRGYKNEKIQDGRFGAMMNVSLTNEVRFLSAPSRETNLPLQGPVTFTIDSRRWEYISEPPSGTSTPKTSTTSAAASTLEASTVE